MQTTTVTLKDSIVASLVRAVNDAAPENRPFGHFYMQNCFSHEVYAGILKNSSESLTNSEIKHPDALTSSGASTRKFFELTPKNLETMESLQREFWNAMADAFYSTELRNAIFSKLSRDLCKRLSLAEADLANLKVYPRAGIFYDHPGYKIRPHPDNAVRFVTVQFYLPPDDSQQNFGTSLYRIRKLRSYWNRLWRIPEDGGVYREVKRFKFVPNSGYAFAVSKKSYHGRPVIEGQTALRKTLMLVYYDRPGVGYDSVSANGDAARAEY